MKTAKTLALWSLILFTSLTATAQSQDEIIIHTERLSERVLLLMEDSPMENILVALATEKGLVVIDSTGSTFTARKMRERIAEEFGRDDFAYLINTHYHWDHSRGNQVFADTTIISHTNAVTQMRQDVANRPARLPQREAFLKNRDAELARLDPDSEEARELRWRQAFSWRNYLSDKEGFQLTLPSLTFQDYLTLNLGDLTLHLHYFGPAHSGSDILIHVPEEGILCTGDLFLDKGWLPLFAGLRKLDVPRFIEVLGRVLDTDDSVRTVIPGHRGTWSREKLVLWRDYIVNLWEGIQLAEAEGLDLAAIIDQFPLEAPYYYLRDLDHDDAEIRDFHARIIQSFYRQIKGTAADLVAQALESEGIEAARARFFDLHKNQAGGIRFEENDFNDLGYQLMNNGELDQAIAVFELNARAFPGSWNVFDSLAEAHLNAGHTQEAILNYEKSIHLNPDNENGKAVLERLKNNS